MTGIRGIAALWVMLYHAQERAGEIFSLPFLERMRILSSGWRGVDLFFMRSGFILMYAHGGDFYAIHKESLLRFARLRFSRVYPLNAVVSLLFAVLLAFQPGFVVWAQSRHGLSEFSAGALVRTLFLANRWFIPGGGDWNQPVWSLSLEALGYVAFPFLAFCALRVARRWQLIGLAFLGLAGSLAVFSASHVYYGSIGQIAVVRMAACFIAGIATFRLWKLADESSKRWAGWITAVSAVGILIAALSYRGGFLSNFLFALLLYGLAFQRGVVNNLLASRIAVFLGEISFPLYLIHLVPLLWLRYLVFWSGAIYPPVEKSAALICWAVGCIVVATLLHYVVEKPFHALGRRWAGTRVAQ
jgi:peptidoglycan/LPS O-acetylase OafA/YrhL